MNTIDQIDQLKRLPFDGAAETLQHVKPTDLLDMYIYLYVTSLAQPLTYSDEGIMTQVRTAINLRLDIDTPVANTRIVNNPPKPQRHQGG